MLVIEKLDQNIILRELKNQGIVGYKIQNTNLLTRALKNLVEICLKNKNYKILGGSIAGHLNFSFGEEMTDQIQKKLINKFLPIAKKYLDTQFCKVVIGGNVNLPNSVNQHWHADSSFFDNWLIMNFLIDDFTEFNGATDFVESTHKKYISYLDYLKMRIIGKFQSNNLKSLIKGSVIIRDSNLWHRGTKNFTQSPRAMLSICFLRSKSDEIFSANKRVGFYQNWFGNKNKFFELIYVYMPILVSVTRFIRSLLKSRKNYSN